MKTTTMKAADTGSLTRMRVLLLGMLVAVLATVAVSTWAQPMRHGHGGGMGMGPGMMGGSPEHADRMVDHMLDGLNATDAQRSQIKQIAQAAAADMKAQHQAGRALRQSAMQAFTAPNVDANAVESIRQQMLAQHDQMSRRMTQAMLDISNVLTPEQRATMAARMQERAARMQERMQRGQPSR